MYTLHHAGPRAVASLDVPESRTTEAIVSSKDTPESRDRPVRSPAVGGSVPDPRDEAARALYEERGHLLLGLMAPAAQRWEDLSEDVRQRWRRTSESADPHR